MRQRVFAGLRIFGLGLRWALIDAPAWVLHSPAVRALLHSWPFAFLTRHLLAPLLLAAVAAWLLALYGTDAATVAWGSGAVFVLALALLSSRFGQEVVA